MKKPNLKFNMNISKKDARLLFVLLGIAILLASYLLLYDPYTTKADAVSAEINQLRPVLTELQGHYANLPVYEEGVAVARETIEEESKRYPFSVRPEDMIMYAIRLEDRLGMDITSIGFSEAVPVLAFQTFKENGDGEEVPVDVSAYRVSMTVTFDLSYEEFKELARYVAQTKERSSLNSLSLSFDSATGALTGTATIDKFFISDGSEEYVATSVPTVELGRDDLFGTLLEPETN